MIYYNPCHSVLWIIRASRIARGLGHSLSGIGLYTGLEQTNDPLYGNILGEHQRPQRNVMLWHAGWRYCMQSKRT